MASADRGNQDLGEHSSNAAKHGEETRATIAEYEAALDPEGTVAFSQLTEAAFMRLPHMNLAVSRPLYEKYYPLLLRKFANEHQRIERSYFASHVRAAAVLTKDKELFVSYPQGMFDDVESLDLLSRLTLLHVRARQFLSEGDYKDCMDPVFEVIVYCLSSFDKPAASRGSEGDIARLQESRLADMLIHAHDRAEQDLWQMVQRKALIRYFYGMLAGLAVAITAGSLLGLARPLLPVSTLFAPESNRPLPAYVFNSNYLLQVAAIAGSIGATISVLQRISAGKFTLVRSIITLQQARRPSMLYVLGGFRPAIGAIFGIALYVFQSAGLVPFVPPPDVSLPIYFAALAFIAGFSERFAQDMVLAQPTTSEINTSKDKSAEIEGGRVDS